MTAVPCRDLYYVLFRLRSLEVLKIIKTVQVQRSTWHLRTKNFLHYFSFIFPIKSNRIHHCGELHIVYNSKVEIDVLCYVKVYHLL
jgi:hypothetical protein